MIFDKCGNCRYYETEPRYVKAFFSKKPKVKPYDHGVCSINVDVFKDRLHVNGCNWCSKYERKGR